MAIVPPWIGSFINTPVLSEGPGGTMHTCRGSPWLPAVASAAALLGVGCGHGGGGGGGAAPPAPVTNTATSNVSFKMFAGSAPKCSMSLRWEWTPVSLLPGPGRNTAFPAPSSGLAALEVSPAGDVCLFTNFSLERLAPGTWRIALQTPQGPLAACQVTLKAGPNWAGFRQGAPTCRLSTGIGFFYP